MLNVNVYVTVHGPFEAGTFFSIYAGFCKYEAITTFAENVRPIGLTVTVFIRGLHKKHTPVNGNFYTRKDVRCGNLRSVTAARTNTF